MIELECGKGDSHEFLHIASRLITGAAIATELPEHYGVWVARVNGFFGRTWLGFRGKFIGQFGMHNRSLSSDLAMPPFFFKRVQSVRYFTRDTTGEWIRSQLPFPRSLSVVTSKDNVNRKIHLKGLYAWYSTGSEDDEKGALMVYAIRPRSNAAWYTMWEKGTQWKLVQHIGIAPRTVRHFINLGTHESSV
jgi:hypothetical protein